MENARLLRDLDRLEGDIARLRKQFPDIGDFLDRLAQRAARISERAGEGHEGYIDERIDAMLTRVGLHNPYAVPPPAA